MRKHILRTLLAAITCLATGCSENIDDSARYVFDGETITSYLARHHERFSQYYDILGHVRVSSISETSLRSLLSARGNYTVFAPTNDALRAYLDTLVAHEIIPEPRWDAFTDSTVLDSIRRVIATNSIIDGGDFDISGNGIIYATSAFPGNTNEEIPSPTMADRKITVRYGDIDRDSIWINRYIPMHMKNRDIPAVNGVIHQIEGVIAPENNSLWNYLDKFIKGGRTGYCVAARMVQACGLADTLNRISDERYHEYYLRGLVTDLTRHPTEGSIGYIPQQRKYGYTFFAETDDFWKQELGKEPADITMQDVCDYLSDNGYYPDAIHDNDYTNPRNILNQFITYHLLPERIPVDKLVVHYNEKGYDPNSGTLGVAMYELYTTMGQRRLLKIYESRESKGVYLNRFPNLNNGRKGNYHERSCDADKRGVLVGRENADVEPVNAIIYPINEILAYTDHTRDCLARQRLRFDISSIFPEFMNNDIRAQTLTTPRNLTVGIPSNDQYKYFNDMDILPGSKFYYLSGRGKGWPNYLGDEFNVIGRYDLIMRLPPVPKRGTYELRIANSCGVNYRSMCQVYWGENPDALPACGTPLDFRVNGLWRMTDAGNFPSPVGWEADTGDDDYDAEVDKRMRNNGFMKGLEIYCAGMPGAATTGRGTYYETRRIMLTETMDPDHTYYIRFKNVLDFEDKQLFLDFIEFCPKEVYNNPMEPEDIW